MSCVQRCYCYINVSKRANSWLEKDVWVLWQQEKQNMVTVFPVLSADAISSGDDEDDTERSDDVGVDGEQMREYRDRGPNTSCHRVPCEMHLYFRCWIQMQHGWHTVFILA